MALVSGQVRGEQPGSRAQGAVGLLHRWCPRCVSEPSRTGTGSVGRRVGTCLLSASEQPLYFGGWAIPDYTTTQRPPALAILSVNVIWHPWVRATTGPLPLRLSWLCF